MGRPRGTSRFWRWGKSLQSSLGHLNSEVVTDIEASYHVDNMIYINLALNGGVWDGSLNFRVELFKRYLKLWDLISQLKNWL